METFTRHGNRSLLSWAEHAAVVNELQAATELRLVAIDAEMAADRCRTTGGAAVAQLPARPRQMAPRTAWKRW